jgi:hypothetical protein
MGLDAVEIVMEVEEAFDIRLEDAEVEKMDTPRDLIESVLSKVAQTGAAACLTQRAFNLLRRKLLHHLALKRRDVSPSARLVDLVPRPKRSDLLQHLAAEFGTQPLPGLVRPQWLVALLTTGSLAVGIAVGGALVTLAPASGPAGGIFAGVFTAAIVGFLAGVASIGLRTEFPPLTATVGDLSRWIVAHKPDLAPSAPGKWTREQVAERVREIVIEKLGCAGSYREAASFVKDLGLS